MRPGIVGFALFGASVLILLAAGLGFSLLWPQVLLHFFPHVRLPQVVEAPAICAAIDAGAITPAIIIRAVLSAILLLASLFVILTKRYAEQDRHWAYGTVGTIVGFWLKGS